MARKYELGVDDNGEPWATGIRHKAKLKLKVILTYKELQFCKRICPHVKTNCPAAENVSEIPALRNKSDVSMSEIITMHALHA